MLKSIEELNLTPGKEDDLLYLWHNIKNQTSMLSLVWISVSNEYLLFCVLLLLPFMASYTCGVGFSTRIRLKTKERNLLNSVGDMCVALSSCESDWAKITCHRHTQQVNFKLMYFICALFD